MTSTENNSMNTDTVEAKVRMGGKQVTRRKGIAGVIFVGCLMRGFAAGFLIDNIPAGLFAGLGVGFIAMGIASYKTGSW